jgi:hypothetical protein
MGTKDVKEFRRNLFGQCPALQPMWDLSDAAHHRVLTRRTNPPHSVYASTAAYDPLPTGLGIKDYGNKPFLAEAEAAADFWRRWKD